MNLEATFAKVQKRIEEILQNRDKKADQLREEIETQNRKIAEFEKIKKDLTDADGADFHGDHAAYARAKKDQEAAEDLKGIYEKMLSNLYEKPLISEKEYKSLADEIQKALNSKRDELEAETLKAAKALYGKGEDFQDQNETGAEILQQLQGE